MKEDIEGETKREQSEEVDGGGSRLMGRPEPKVRRTGGCGRPTRATTAAATFSSEEQSECMETHATQDEARANQTLQSQEQFGHLYGRIHLLLCDISCGPDKYEKYVWQRTV